MALAQRCADVSVGHRDPQLPWQKIQAIYVSEYVKAQVPPPLQLLKPWKMSPE